MYSKESFELIKSGLKSRNIAGNLLRDEEFCCYVAIAGRHRRNILPFRITGVIQQENDQIVVLYSIFPTTPAFLVALFILWSVTEGVVMTLQGSGSLLFTCVGIAILGLFISMVLWQMGQCISRFEKQLYEMAHVEIIPKKRIHIQIHNIPRNEVWIGYFVMIPKG